MLATILDRAARTTRAVRDDGRLREVVAALVRAGYAEAGWRVIATHQSHWSPIAPTTAIVGPDGDPRLVVKLPHTPAGAASLAAEHRTLWALRADPRLGDRLDLIPGPIAAIGDLGRESTVETALPGRPAAGLTGDEARSATSEAFAWIRTFHRRTAAVGVVDAARLERWVDRPMAAIEAAVPHGRLDPREASRFRLGLREVLIGRTLTTGWIHGDLWLGNVLVDEAGSGLRGIVDWDRAAPDELPWHDVFQLLLGPERFAEPGSADVVAAAATGGRTWSADDRLVLDGVRRDLGDESPSTEVLVALYWLRSVAMTLATDPALGRDRAFVREHVARLVELPLPPG